MSESSSVSPPAVTGGHLPSPSPMITHSDNTTGRPAAAAKMAEKAGSTDNPQSKEAKSPGTGPSSTTSGSRGPSPVGTSQNSDAKREDGTFVMTERNGTLQSPEAAERGKAAAGVPIKEERTQGADGSRKRRASNDSVDVRHPERKRRGSNESLDSSTKASEGAAEDGRDDENDEDDEEEDKLLSKDPEKLKAFNMFVRLFVDENLDRSVPISKQPKDKIQAILEACDRQFPEFHERARKRVRTYLKSCRRMRRSKDGNGWEQLRPTPPHLTSAAAEALLALACENESNNAKRMRMGLEPLPASAMLSNASTATSNGVTTPASTPQSQHSPNHPTGASGQTSSTQTANSSSASLGSSSPSPTPAHAHTHAHSNSYPAVQAQPPPPPPPPPSLSSTTERPAPSGGGSTNSESYGRGHGSASSQPTAFRPPHELSSPFTFTGTNGLFRPGFPSSYQHPAHHHSPVLQHSSLLQNGPTDLSMKKSPNTSTKNQLNPSEVATIKQLIAGYRESAAFLYRSADELEQLLLQQN